MLWLRWIILIIASWYAMLTAHELGHVLHAWISGARIAGVEIPFFGFSRTDVHGSAHPQFIAWGGAVWGCLIPLLCFTLTRKCRGVVAQALRFFAGFCLIANGAYLSVGSFDGVGDAGDLLRHGAPRWCLIAFGVVTIPAGLWLWHGIPYRSRDTTPPAPRAET
jgi:hypothetical protein